IGGELPTFITFYPAVMVAALLGGLGPGLLATALSVAVVDFWVLSPRGSFAVAKPADVVALALFASMGIFMSLVAEACRRNQQKVAALKREVALHESQQALRDSDAKMQGIVGSAMDAIISVDNEQRIVVFNRAAEMIFQCAASVAIGSTLDRFIPQRLREVHREHIRRFGTHGVTNRSMISPG